jgi:hypothetical protein
MTDHERQPDPDPVETDPFARSAAEDLDEDELRVDPLEKGMDPPERWSAADRRGTTPREQREPAPLADRLAEEQPDVAIPDRAAEDQSDVAMPDPAAEGPPVNVRGYDGLHGTSADIAGGSMADEIRTPPENEDD